MFEFEYVITASDKAPATGNINSRWIAVIGTTSEIDLQTIVNAPNPITAELVESTVKSLKFSVSVSDETIIVKDMADTDVGTYNI